MAPAAEKRVLDAMNAEIFVAVEGEYGVAVLLPVILALLGEGEGAGMAAAGGRKAYGFQ